MNILIKRIAKKPSYTIGKMYIDGKYFADTLEDTDRGLDQKMPLSEITAKKVYAETAIPTGTYKITMNVISNKFNNRVWAKPYGGKVPRILDVPAFEGVLLHPGTTAQDTYGCIILGKNKLVGKVLESQATFKQFMDKLKGQNNINITIQ